METQKQELKKLREENLEQRKLIAKLQEKIAELESRLNKNSQNSNQPPSSDGLNKPNPKSRRKKGTRKSGGQAGHKGHFLKQVEYPNRVINHYPKTCTGCGKDLTKGIPILDKKRQVFDIPELTLEIEEHRAHQVCCDECGKFTQGTFPEQVRYSAQYGNRVKSLMVYLNQYQLLPTQRVEEFFQDIFNHTISEGTLYNTNQEMYEALKEPEEKIKGSLQSSEVLHADETSIRVNKQQKWLHVASHPKLTHYGFHEKRGSEAMAHLDILPHFKGTLVHDHLKSYFRYGKNHGLCNAHHLRELTSIQERFGHKWSFEMEKLLLDIKKAVEDAQTRQEVLPIETQKKWYRKYQNLIRRGRKESPRIENPNKKGRIKQTDAVNLLDRLRMFGQDVLRFMFDPKVPFDNNQAERDIRMTKVRQKISGCFRTEMGAHIFCRIRSYISSAKKQNVSILGALHSAISYLPIPLVLN